MASAESYLHERKPFCGAVCEGLLRAAPDDANASSSRKEAVTKRDESLTSSQCQCCMYTSVVYTSDVQGTQAQPALGLGHVQSIPVYRLVFRGQHEVWPSSSRSPKAGT